MESKLFKVTEFVRGLNGDPDATKEIKTITDYNSRRFDGMVNEFLTMHPDATVDIRSHAISGSKELYDRIHFVAIIRYNN